MPTAQKVAADHFNGASASLRLMSILFVSMIGPYFVNDRLARVQ